MSSKLEGKFTYEEKAMSKDATKTPTPQPHEAANVQAPAKAKKTFSFSFFRKDNGDKAFADKVAPSKRELEAQAVKRRAQRAKMQGGLKPQPTLHAESEVEEQVVQPV
jgi:hypothetical protein